MTKVNIDTKKHKNAGFPVAPAGNYKAVLVSDERKTAQSGNDYLNQKFKITRGKYKGIGFFNICNLWNENETTAAMAKEEISALTIAIFGEDRKVKDTKILFNKEFDVALGVEEYKGKDKNVVDYFGKGKEDKGKEKPSKKKGKSSKEEKSKKKKKGKKSPKW